MRRFLVICMTICATVTGLYGQDQQYIVKLNGDTIYGKIMINPVRDNSKQIFFKRADGTKEQVRPLRCAYVYYNEKYQFRSVPLLNQKLFMQIVQEDSKVSLYNYVHKRDNSIVTSRIMVKPDNSVIELSILNYKNQMQQFMEDCPKVVAKLESREYKYKNHRELLDEYNSCEPQTRQVTQAVVTTSPPAAPPQTTVQANSIPKDPSIKSAEMKSGVALRSDIQLLRLKKIAAYKDYVNSLSNLEFRSDVLDLLVDLENRINLNSEIPGYLWNSLSAMVQDNPDLIAKTDQLRLDIK